MGKCLLYSLQTEYEGMAIPLIFPTTVYIQSACSLIFIRVRGAADVEQKPKKNFCADGDLDPIPLC